MSFWSPKPSRRAVLSGLGDREAGEYEAATRTRSLLRGRNIHRRIVDRRDVDRRMRDVGRYCASFISCRRIIPSGGCI